MELPKKPGQRARKYMGFFCLILVCAGIATVIALLVNKNDTESNSPSTVTATSSPLGQIMSRAIIDEIHESGENNTAIILEGKVNFIQMILVRIGPQHPTSCRKRH
jgi:hypothetical protein